MILGNIGLVLLATSAIIIGVKKAETFDKSEGEGILFISKDDVRDISVIYALLFPFIGSMVLVLLYFFLSNILKYVIVGGTIIFAFTSIYVLLHPLTVFLSKSVSTNVQRVFNLILSLLFVVYWIVSMNYPLFFWVMNNFVANALMMIYFCILRFANLKVSVILLVGLFIYDAFWVFGSERIFSENVMVSVAEKMIFENFLPATLIFPRSFQSFKNLFTLDPNAGRYNFTMLGLGDVLIPGLFILTANKCDHVLGFKKGYYFYITMASYVIALELTILIAWFFEHAQPALIYIVPFLLISFFSTAFLNGDLKTLWSIPLTQRVKIPTSPRPTELQDQQEDEQGGESSVDLESSQTTNEEDEVVEVTESSHHTDDDSTILPV